MIVAEVDRMTGGDDDEYFPFIDTIDLAKKILDRGPYNLPALLDRLRLDNPYANAAVADATATVNMLHALFGFKRGEIGRKILHQGQAFHATNTWQASHATVTAQHIGLLPAHTLTIVVGRSGHMLSHMACHTAQHITRVSSVLRPAPTAMCCPLFVKISAQTVHTLPIG